MNIINRFAFHLPKKGAGADPKKLALAPAPTQILNRLRLLPINLGSDRYGSATLVLTETNLSLQASPCLETKKFLKYTVCELLQYSPTFLLAF